MSTKKVTRLDVGPIADAPVISLGCMRMAALSDAEAQEIVSTALDSGIDFFDHADIYGGGDSERRFAAAAKALGIGRDKLTLQSKCGIGQGEFNFSRDYILGAVDGILERLETDYLDVLLLHRPDALVEPEEVAEAFDRLESSGKVRHFGVSNHNPAQLALLERYVRQPLKINQLQLSLMHCPMIDAGLNVNMENDAAIVRGSDVLERSRLNDVVIQAWSPLQYGMIEGNFVGNADFPEVNAALDEVAATHGVSPHALAIAWILRHPAAIQVVVGTMNPKHLRDLVTATGVELSRSEWYALYRATGKDLP